jgi:hypothetical protein
MARLLLLVSSVVVLWSCRQAAQVEKREVAMTPQARTEQVLQPNSIRFDRKVIQQELPERGYSFAVNYPQVFEREGVNLARLNQLVESQILQRKNAFNRSAKIPTKHRKQPDIYNDLRIDYELVFNADELVSIWFFVVDYYWGAAHPGNGVFTINFDLKKGQPLELKQVFSQTSNYEKLLAQLCDEYFQPRAWRKVEKVDRWNFNEKGITLNFDRCEMLACGEGVQKVFVPYSQIKQLIRSDGPLAKFVQS